MCTNKRWIYNKFIGKKVFIDCGVCPSCRQKYANKVASRIRHHCPVGYKPYFFHLTYSNDYVPYIKRSELESIENYDSKDLDDLLFSVPVYRATHRFRYSHYDYIEKHFVSDIVEMPQEVVLSTMSNSNGSDSRLYYKPLKISDYARLKKLRGQGDNEKIGVIWYPDVQNFFKRLSKKVSQSSLGNKHFSHFVCSELGGTFERPHFHVLLWIPEAFAEWYKCAVVECWPFALPYLTKHYFEPARNAAKYVSTYINKHLDFSKFFRYVQRRNKERFSHSKYFGFGDSQFEFNSVIENLERGIITYNTFVRTGFKQYSYDAVPLPRYVFSRFFPINFKAISRFTDNEIQDIVRQPLVLLRYVLGYPHRFEYRDFRKVVVPLNVEGVIKLKKTVESGSFSLFRNIDEIFHAIFYIERKFYNFRCLFYDYMFNSLKKDYAYELDLNLSDSLLREYFAYYTIQYLKSIRHYRWLKHFEKNDSDKDNLERYDNFVDYTLDLLPADLSKICVKYEVNPIDLNPNSFGLNLHVSNEFSEEYFSYATSHQLNDLISTLDDGKY